MRRRILLAIIGTTVVISTVLTVPLAVFAARREHDLAVRSMSLEAQEVHIGLTRDGPFDPDEIEDPEQESNVEVGVYLTDGRLAAGEGPPEADEVTRRAVFLQTNERVDGAVVLVQPVVQGGERVATIRLAEIEPETGQRIERVLALLLAVNLGAAGFAALVGWVVAARLARPVALLRDDAVRLGDGDFSVAPRRSGIGEVDDTADALAGTATRLGELVRKEREFSANASHQLRTPLASLRILIEGELATPRPDAHQAFTEALADVDRLQATLDTMLAVARGATPSRAPMNVRQWADDLAEGSTAGARAGGTAHGEPDLTVVCTCDRSFRVSRPVLDQIVDVLVTNARQHGRGTVSVTATCDDERLIVDVTDDGRLDRDPAGLFERHDPGASGNGVGLALARSLAESEGGRLVVHRVEPTTFRLWLPDHSADPIAGSTTP